MIAALLVTDVTHSPLGLSRNLAQPIGKANALTHAVRRLASVPKIQRIVLVHPAGQDPLALLPAAVRDALRVEVETCDAGVSHDDPWRSRMASSRKWADTAWRGGLGQSTVWDELLPAGPLVQAMQQVDADTAVIAGGDWCVVDPELTARQLDIHLGAPEAMKLTFTQAPPGLSPLVTSRAVLTDLAAHDAGICQTLRYNPSKPTIDPIGREANLPIPAEVRDHARRFLADLPSTTAHLQALADHLGQAFETADAAAVVNASKRLEARMPSPADQPRPRHLHVCLTPRRTATGPITPQHHLPDFAAGPDLDFDTARRLFDDLGQTRDATVVLGHHGEPTLHPRFVELVQHAHNAGILGIAIETDLLMPRDEALALLLLPLDLIVVRLNADTAQTYHHEMGVDSFKRVAENTVALLAAQAEPASPANPRSHPRPWIMPALTKVTGTLKDMESFFERWIRTAGQALITPFCTAQGLIPDRSPVPMAPPPGVTPPPRLKQRLTVLPDARLTLCREDLTGIASLGSLQDACLSELWARTGHREIQHAGLCWRCRSWHARAHTTTVAGQAA